MKAISEVINVITLYQKKTGQLLCCPVCAFMNFHLAFRNKSVVAIGPARSIIVHHALFLFWIAAFFLRPMPCAAAIRPDPIAASLSLLYTLIILPVYFIISF
ncbi:hypothetical protein [uncultured Dubosiella sp.]|uniref:hypothetical protein n=1 Tax=uncultured Dubosiella sp. TaxID=1937011 RepID=UPI0026199B10|nr:hypothetical protein [uncultured Dubosiella sp.]